MSKLQNLKRRQHREKLRFKKDMKNSSYNLKQMQQREKLRFNENMNNSSSSLKQMRQREKQRLQAAREVEQSEKYNELQQQLQ
ncbi:hypothetical protein Gotur_003040, partial [Gossypium turneri]